MPRRALPSGTGRARGRVLHPGRVERRAPALLVVLGQLEVVALAVHPDGDVPDPTSRRNPHSMPRAVGRAVALLPPRGLTLG